MNEDEKPKRGNPQNLKPIVKGEKRSEESIQKQKETCARKRALREIAKAILDEVRRGGNKTVKEEIFLAQINKALEGDLKSAEFCLKAAGEDIGDAQKVELGGNISIEPITGINIVNEEEE